MTLQYWFMFPITVLFAAIAMACGVGGATFFSPFVILALGPLEGVAGRAPQKLLKRGRGALSMLVATFAAGEVLS